MNEYETVYVLQPDLAATGLKKVKEKVEKALIAGKAEILVNEDWGKRKLAYNIGKFQFGHYIYFNYSGDGHFINELERILRLDELVLRFLTVKLSKEARSSKGKTKKVTQPEEFKMVFDESRPFRSSDKQISRRRDDSLKGEKNAKEI